MNIGLLVLLAQTTAPLHPPEETPPVLHTPHFWQLHAVPAPSDSHTVHLIEFHWSCTNAQDFEISSQQDTNLTYKLHFNTPGLTDFAWGSHSVEGTHTWVIRSLTDEHLAASASPWSNPLTFTYHAPDPKHTNSAVPSLTNALSRNLLSSNALPATPTRRRWKEVDDRHWCVYWAYVAPQPLTNHLARIYQSTALNTWNVFTNLDVMQNSGSPVSPGFYKVSIVDPQGQESWNQTTNLIIVDP